MQCHHSKLESVAKLKLVPSTFIYIQYYMDVCVHGGLHRRRKAGASKWTKSGLPGPSSSSCLPFRGPKNGAKNRPQKRGRNIAGKRQGFQNGGPVSRTRVLHTPSAPLCVQWVTETPEPFVCFPGNGLDKASSKFHREKYIYLSVFVCVCIWLCFIYVYVYTHTLFRWNSMKCLYAVLFIILHTHMCVLHTVCCRRVFRASFSKISIWEQPSYI